MVELTGLLGEVSNEIDWFRLVGSEAFQVLGRMMAETLLYPHVCKAIVAL